MLIIDWDHVQFTRNHCIGCTIIYFLTVLLLILSWSIPQTVYYVRDQQTCFVVSIEPVNITTCTPSCQCNETPDVLLSSTPYCNDTMQSGVLCNNGYACCQVSCDSCTVCLETGCQAYQCNCACVQKAINDYCVQECVTSLTSNCTTNLNSSILQSDCSLTIHIGAV